MNVITSRDNAKIKYVRSLNAKKLRDQEKVFTVEGIKFVREAFKEKADIKFVLFSESTILKDEVKEMLDGIKAEAFVCTDDVFDSVAETVNAQGVLAVIGKKQEGSADFRHLKFAVMCDRIQDPGNLGTIIRTADAFGPAVVILNKGCVDQYNPKVVRASAGAIFRVPFIHADNDHEAVLNLKQAGFKVYSTVVESEYSFEDVEKSEKICVVIGNEGQGVSEEIAGASHQKITIRMSGRAESLNASIAAGICIYEMRKKLL